MNLRKTISILQTLLFLLLLISCSVFNSTSATLSKIPEFNHNRTAKSITANWENRSVDTKYDWYLYDFTANGNDSQATDEKFKLLIGTSQENLNKFINNQTKVIFTGKSPLGNIISWDYASENFPVGRKYGIIVRSSSDTSNWSVYTFDIK